MDDREYELKQVELTLREREISAREREVAAKEKESNASWWKNPLVLTIAGATLALLTTILTTFFNNLATDKTEHFRAQSNLVVEVIKTGGNEESACKNLNFFVSIGWLDDPKGTIHNRCGTKGEGGVPTLPASSNLFDQPPPGTVASELGRPMILGNLVIGLAIRVEDEESHQPIENATVELRSGPEHVLSLAPYHITTDSRGVATISNANGTDVITVSKEGYETRDFKSITEFLATSTPSTLTAFSTPVVTLRRKSAPGPSHGHKEKD